MHHSRARAESTCPESYSLVGRSKRPTREALCSNDSGVWETAAAFTCGQMTAVTTVSMMPGARVATRPHAIAGTAAMID